MNHYGSYKTQLPKLIKKELRKLLK